MSTRTKVSHIAQLLGKELRQGDRISDKYQASMIEKAQVRAASLDTWPITRPAHYALAWGISTGRISAELIQAAVDMPPAEFVQAAIGVAEKHGGGALRDAWEAWKEALQKAASKREKRSSK